MKKAEIKYLEMLDIRENTHQLSKDLKFDLSNVKYSAKLKCDDMFIFYVMIKIIQKLIIQSITSDVVKTNLEIRSNFLHAIEEKAIKNSS